MLRLLWLILGVAWSLPCFSQAADSITINAVRISPVGDSVMVHNINRIDSLQQQTREKLIALKHGYDSIGFCFDSLSNRLLLQVDSLSNQGFPTEGIYARVDSLQQLKTRRLEELKAEANKIKNTWKGEINAATIDLHLSVEATSVLDEYANSLNYFDLSLPGNYIAFPTLEMDQFTGLALPGLNNPFDKLGQLELDGARDAIDKFVTPLQDLQDGMQLPAVNDVAEQVEDQAGRLAVEKIGDLQAPPSMPSEEEAKHQLLEHMREQAIDHFAGRQNELKAAMDKISKLKRKYPSVQSLEDLPKRRYNPWSDKPLIERLVPALTLQVQKKNEWYFDINPMIGYHFNKRITAGLGWNHRFPVNAGDLSIKQRTRVYGARTYTDFSVGRYLSIRAEVECLNSPVFSLPKQDISHREWIWSAMVGLKREYKISKSLRGNAQILYNLFDPHHKSPYVDRMNMRMGIEILLRKPPKDTHH